MPGSYKSSVVEIRFKKKINRNKLSQDTIGNSSEHFHPIIISKYVVKLVICLL